MKKLKLKIKEGQELHDFQKESMQKMKEHLKKVGTVVIKVPDRIGKGEIPK